MTLESLTAFALAMTLLAVSPGPGLATVLSHSLASGPKSGLAVVAGLVLIDFAFLAIAILGLSAIAQMLGPLFQVAKYVCATYLIYVGCQLFKASPESFSLNDSNKAPYWRSASAGALVTLGNPKAILFYSALLPALFEIENIGLLEYSIVGSVICVVSFLVYGTYIYIAERSRNLSVSTKTFDFVRKTSGGILVGTGLVVASR